MRHNRMVFALVVTIIATFFYILVLPTSAENPIIRFTKKWSCKVESGDITSISNSGSKIFICSCDENVGGQIICVEDKSGILLWQVKDIEAKSSFATQDALYANRARNELAKYNANTGEILWFRKEKSYVVEPIIYKNNLYSTVLGDAVYCINPSNGKTIWSFAGKFYAKVFREGDLLIVEDNKIIALSVVTGKKIWELSFNEHINYSSLRCDGERLFIAGKNKIICVSITTRKVLWETSVEHFEDDLFNFILAGDKMIFLSKEHLGTRGINVENGKIIWRKNFNGWLTLDMIYNQGIVYVRNLVPNLLLGFNPINGEVLFEKKITHTDLRSQIKFSRDGFVVTLKNSEYNGIEYYSKAANELEFRIGENTYFADKIGYNMDVKPTIINSMTYIPAKYILEPFGGQVNFETREELLIDYDEKTGFSSKKVIFKETKCQLLKKEVVLMISLPTATVNGKKVQIDPKNPKITPIIKDGRTMVPLRFLAENLGCTVKWVADTKTIIVTYQP